MEETQIPAFNDYEESAHGTEHTIRICSWLNYGLTTVSNPKYSFLISDSNFIISK
jgi:hypothetical protein